MFRSTPDSASATFFFMTDHRSTDKTVADPASCTATHTGITWVFRPRKPRPPPR